MRPGRTLENLWETETGIIGGQVLQKFYVNR